MVIFSKYYDRLSKIFSMILLGSIVSLVIITYTTEVEQHLGILYLRHTFNQSATNFQVLNESRLIHNEQIKHELQIANDTTHIDRMLTQINHTMFNILENGRK